MEPVPSDELPPKLTEVLDALPDGSFAERLRAVLQSASTAISKLADVDLLQYETNSVVETGADLSLWEEIAPVLMETIGHVNAVLAAIRENFPVGANPMLAPGTTQRRIRAVETVIQNCAGTLGQLITQLGEKMRSPSVVSDRWNLLTETQAFRSRFRQVLGDLEFDSASALGEFTRDEVVPGHRAEIASAVRVRATVADLYRVMAARRDKLGEAEEEDVQWNAQQLAKELDMFGKTPAYRSLRAQDKRRILELKSELTALVAEPALSKLDLEAQLHPFVDFIGSLREVNRREILQEHDREVLAACGVMLEHAENQLAVQPAATAQALVEAIGRAHALYGRDAELDLFLRRARKVAFDTLSGPALALELEKFRDLLVNTSFA